MVNFIAIRELVIQVLNPLAIEVDGSVLDIFAGLAFGRRNAALNQHFYNVVIVVRLDGVARNTAQSLFELLGREGLDISGKELLGDFQGFLVGFFSVD